MAAYCFRRVLSPECLLPWGMNMIAASILAHRAESYLQQLCVTIPDRRVGSAGNRAATDLFARTVQSFGFSVETPEFDCIDWAESGVSLTVGDESFTAFASPYSLGVRLTAPLVVVRSADKLESVDLAGKIVLLRGEIAREQLMPKNFTFYNPDEHQRIIHLLEAKQPLAIIAATTQDPQMAGPLYPFPLIEDGDFDIPSVYMTEDEGARLAAFAGKMTSLESHAERIPSTGCSVFARKGRDPERKVVCCAHIDAKRGVPGAIDNASGVIVMLLLAELLTDYSGGLTVEIVAINGEDYYANPGEMQVMALNDGQFDKIALAINVDGVGYVKGRAAYSLYECPEPLAQLIRGTFAGQAALMEGEPWYQGDHVLFIMNGRPTLAFTSEHVMELVTEIIHTPADSPDIVDPQVLVTVATALRDLILRLNGVHEQTA